MSQLPRLPPTEKLISKSFPFSEFAPLCATAQMSLQPDQKETAASPSHIPSLPLLSSSFPSFLWAVLPLSRPDCDWISLWITVLTVPDFKASSCHKSRARALLRSCFHCIGGRTQWCCGPGGALGFPHPLPALVLGPVTKCETHRRKWVT